MVSDQEPRYRLVDDEGNIVGSLYGKPDGSVAIQETDSGADREVTLAPDGTFSAPSVETESVSTESANIESTDVNEIKEHIETKDVSNETDVSFSVDTNEFIDWSLELDNLQEGNDQNRIAIRVNGIDDPEYYFYDISGTKHIDETEIALYEPSGTFTFASGDVRMTTRADADILGLNYRPRHARDRLTGIDAVDFGGTDAELNIDDINTIDLISIGGGDWNAGEVSLFGIEKVID